MAIISSVKPIVPPLSVSITLIFRYFLLNFLASRLINSEPEHKVGQIYPGGSLWEESPGQSVNFKMSLQTMPPEFICCDPSFEVGVEPEEHLLHLPLPNDALHPADDGHPVLQGHPSLGKLLG